MIFGLILMYNLFLSPVTALADRATINMLGDERAMYGRFVSAARWDGDYLLRWPAHSYKITD